MTIAITDACIFIDLYELDLTREFFALELEIHTSLDVFNELYPHQQQLLKAYEALGKLFVHNILMEDRLAILKGVYPKALSDNDKTVLYLAEKLGAIVISSDRAIRQFAKKKSIEYHGMLWIFDHLLAKKQVKNIKQILNLAEANNWLPKNPIAKFQCGG